MPGARGASVQGAALASRPPEERPGSGPLPPAPPWPQVITLEGWVEIMYYVMDAHSFYNFIYFILLIIVSAGKRAPGQAQGHMDGGQGVASLGVPGEPLRAGRAGWEREQEGQFFKCSS